MTGLPIQLIESLENVALGPGLRTIARAHDGLQGLFLWPPHYVYVVVNGEPLPKIEEDHRVLEVRVRPESDALNVIDARGRIVPSELPMRPARGGKGDDVPDAYVRTVVVRDGEVPERDVPLRQARASHMQLHPVGVVGTYKGRPFIIPRESLSWLILDPEGRPGQHMLIPLARLRTVIP